MSIINNDNIEFSLPKGGYAAFDATSLKELMIERLSTNNVFTDQNYEGSNLNAFIDIIGYAYHVLIFYLNQTSSESMFSEAQIYENINRIVKTLDYKPIGTQSSTLSFSASARSGIPQGTYTIPRYSYIVAGPTTFSFNRDVTFVKTLTETQAIDEISNNVLVYEGKYKEYPSYTASGTPFETLTLVPGTGVTIDHFNIDVYVREGGPTGEVYKYEPKASLYFEGQNSRAIEIRLNENQRYEIKFGDGITGKQLSADDIVYVYYLVNNGTKGEISEFAATGEPITVYTTPQFSDIIDQETVRGEGVEYMSQSTGDYMMVANSEPSTKYYPGETVEEIKEQAPKTFSSQYRLVSKADYSTFIKSNFSNFIVDVQILNNDEYLDNHIKYYYDLGLTSPTKESRVMYNQMKFSTSCNFNNIYCYCVPRIEKTNTLTIKNNFLNSAQKEVMINRMNETKNVTVDPIIMDPVYVSVDIGNRATSESLTNVISDKTKLMIVQDDSSRVNSNDITQRVIKIFKQYFSPTVAKLGMTIDIAELSNSILNINGVSSFYTYRPELTNSYVEGLSLLIWNPVYPELDIIQTTQNYKLPIFKFPYFQNVDQLGSKIQVVRQSDSLSLLKSSGSSVTSVDMSNITSTTTY